MALSTVLLQIGLSMLPSRVASFGNTPIPMPPASSAWDWASDDAFPTYGSPWNPMSSNFGTVMGERDYAAEGWILYDRRLFVGDQNLRAGQVVSGAGTLYFALYNKYSGILRLFYLASDPLAPSTGVYATLKTVNGSNGTTGSSGQDLQGNLFNSAAVGGYSSVFAAPASKRLIAAYAPPSSTGGGGNPWWVFDFPIDYAPNGVGEKRFFTIDVKSVTSTQLTFGGTLAGSMSSVGTSTSYGSLQIPLSLLTTAADIAAPKLISKGLEYLVRGGVKAGDDISKMINDNKGSISDAAAKKLIQAGVGYLQSNFGSTNQTQHVTSFINANFSATGSLTTTYPVGSPVIGVLDPEFNAADAGAPIAVKNKSQNPRLERLGLIGFSRVPKVWIYSAGFIDGTNEGWVWEGNNSFPSIAGKHEYKVEDPWCSGIVALNPGSENVIYDVLTAVTEKNWETTVKMFYDHYYFYSLQKKTSDFSKSKWETPWSSEGTYVTSGRTFKRAPMLPFLTNPIFYGDFNDEGGAWKSFKTKVSNGTYVNDRHIFRERGGITADGEAYDPIAPLAVSVLVKMRGPRGKSEVIQTFRITSAEYVSSRAAFDAINPGYACSERTTAVKREKARRSFAIRDLIQY